jgi:hypothetical protein
MRSLALPHAWQRIIEIVTRKRFPGYPSDQTVQDYLAWSQDWHSIII